MYTTDQSSHQMQFANYYDDADHGRDIMLPVWNQSLGLGCCSFISSVNSS